MVMFFGLCNAPATFQDIMDRVFNNLVCEGWLIIYIDDMLIFFNNIKEHRIQMCWVLQWLQEHNLYLKPEKCKFEVPEVKFLGAIICAGEIAMDPIKLKAIKDWPAPWTVKQVQMFLGFGNFYRWFIWNYSTIVKPLMTLIKKETPFKWNNDCETAFQGLKQQFTEEPVLHIPNPHEPFQLKCDASGVTTGAVLCQKEKDNLWHPCAYLSKSFTATERNYQIYKQELLSIIRAFKAWWHFLQGSPHPVKILMDHKNHTYFKMSQNLNRWQARWHLFIQHFNFILKYHPGKTLIQANALSRKPDHDGGEEDNKEVTLLKDEVFVWSINLELKEQICDTKAQDLQLVLLQTKSGKKFKWPAFGKPEDWSKDNGILLYKDKVYVPLDKDIHQEIIQIHHKPIHMAHSGI